MRDSSFDMEISKRDSNSELDTIKNEPPHYFEVRDTQGKRYCHCGSEKDAKNICEMNWAYDYTYVKIYFPSQTTVDVPYVKVTPDFELPAQQILPERQQEPLDL